MLCMEEERDKLQAGLRSSDAFVLRRCQILLASARGERTPQIAHSLGCTAQRVGNVIRAFHKQGLACLKEGSHRAHRLPHTAFKGRRVWPLALLAEVSFEQGLTPRQVSAETIRATLVHLGVPFQRAKEWIESPDPAYPRKKARVANSAGLAVLRAWPDRTEGRGGS